MKQSKNSIRKQQRKEFHAVMNALSCAEANPEALLRLAEIKEQFFSQIDRSLDDMDAEAAEWEFIRDIRRALSGGGWVTVYRSDGTAMQVKSSLWEYMASRAKSDKQAALAAEYLVRRALGPVHQRHGPQPRTIQ